MSVVIRTKCSLPLLRSRVSRPTSRLRERRTKGNNRSTGFAGATFFMNRSVLSGSVGEKSQMLLLSVSGHFYSHCPTSGYYRAGFLSDGRERSVCSEWSSAQLDQGQRWDKHLMVIVGPVRPAPLAPCAL